LLDSLSKGIQLFTWKVIPMLQKEAMMLKLAFQYPICFEVDIN